MFTDSCTEPPEKEVLERARHDKESGKSASTQAGEFVREEIHRIREGKHGAQSPQQAIAIGLSKARRAGVKLRPPKRDTSLKTRAQRAATLERGSSPSRKNRPESAQEPSWVRSNEKADQLHQEQNFQSMRNLLREGEASDLFTNRP